MRCSFLGQQKLLAEVSNCILLCWKDQWLLVCLSHLWISFYSCALCYMTRSDCTDLKILWCLTFFNSAQSLIQESTQHKVTKEVRAPWTALTKRCLQRERQWSNFICLWKIVRCNCKRQLHSGPHNLTDLSGETVLLKKFKQCYVKCWQYSCFSTDIRSVHCNRSVLWFLLKFKNVDRFLSHRETCSLTAHTRRAAAQFDKIYQSTCAVSIFTLCISTFQLIYKLYSSVVVCQIFTALLLPHVDSHLPQTETQTCLFFSPNKTKHTDYCVNVNHGGCSWYQYQWSAKIFNINLDTMAKKKQTILWCKYKKNANNK